MLRIYFKYDRSLYTLHCLDKTRTSFSTSPGPHTLTFLSRYFSKNPLFIYTPTDAGGFIKSDPSEPIPDLQLQFAALRMQPHGHGVNARTEAC